MFNDKKGRWSTVFFVIVVIILPVIGLLIMDDQLTKANDITGSVTVDTASSANQTFAGILIIALVIVGLMSLLLNFKERKNRKMHEVNTKIDDISEKLKKL